MDYYAIKGGGRLQGDVDISGSKNAALPLITAALLTSDEVILENVPDLQDIATIIKLVESLGVTVTHKPDQGIVTVQARDITSVEAPYELVKTMRASTYVMGPLLARFGEARVSMPGGCAIGQRPVDIHIQGFKALGANINLEHGIIHARCEAKQKSAFLTGCNFRFSKVSVGATANIIMGSVLASGTTVLENCAMEPEISNLTDFLLAMGAKIHGAGTEKIVIEGVKKLHGTRFRVIPDRIETGTFLLAAAITKGQIRVRKTHPEMVRALLVELERIGYIISLEADSITIFPSKKNLGVDIKTKVYPGFPTDLQAPMMALMTTLPGLSVIVEDIFENRYTHIGELLRMGADIVVENGVAIIRGGKKLTGAKLMMTDLRAGAALVIAALAAKDDSEIQRIYHTDRGYERFEEKLSALGAKISRKRNGK